MFDVPCMGNFQQAEVWDDDMFFCVPLSQWASWQSKVGMQAVPEVKKNALDRWPILREGDGGTHVHQLHCALGRRGYHCGEDDEVWWQFGDSTFSALVAFQVRVTTKAQHGERG